MERTKANAVSALDVASELAAAVPPDELALARERTLARVEVVQRGPWRFQPLRHPAAFGLMVFEGLVGARVAIGEEAHLEVLGGGDLLRPWVHIEPDASVPSMVDWRAFERTSVAVLDEQFARSVAPWPTIAAGLMHRLVLRARRLSFQLALAGISRTDERLLTALWHFADRWGRMTPEGVTLRLAITQAQLGEVIRAARPSVSTAINDLRRDGELSFDRRAYTWTLHGAPPRAVGRLNDQVGLHGRMAD